MKNLLHFAKDQISLDQSRKYKQAAGPKPHGLWVSVGHAWRKWCEGEQWNLSNIKTVHEVVVDNSANLLHLKTAEEIKQFALNYEKSDLGELSSLPSGLFIDWPQIALQFDGIIISPYCWEARNSINTMFYNGWDCASGCIWNANRIVSVQQRNNQWRTKTSPQPCVGASK